MTASERTTEGFEAVGDAVKELYERTGDTGWVEIDKSGASGGITVSTLRYRIKNGSAFVEVTASGSFEAGGGDVYRLGSLPNAFSGEGIHVGTSYSWASASGYGSALVRTTGQTIQAMNTSPTAKTSIIGVIHFPLDRGVKQNV